MKAYIVQLEDGLYQGPTRFCNRRNQMKIKEVKKRSKAYIWWNKKWAHEMADVLRSKYSKVKVMEATYGSNKTNQF